MKRRNEPEKPKGNEPVTSLFSQKKRNGREIQERNLVELASKKSKSTGELERLGRGMEEGPTENVEDKENEKQEEESSKEIADLKKMEQQEREEAIANKKKKRIEMAKARERKQKKLQRRLERERAMEAAEKNKVVRVASAKK